jgi:hypothetical protein
MKTHRIRITAIEAGAKGPRKIVEAWGDSLEDAERWFDRKASRHRGR